MGWVARAHHPRDPDREISKKEATGDSEFQTLAFTF